MRPEDAARPRRIAGLDGLRAIAVVLVIAFHAFPGAVPGGFVGVDVFFVISGFLITGLLLQRPVQGAALRGFWVRRARRLLPALLLVLVAATAVAGMIGGDVLVGIGWQLLGGLTFSFNWLAIANGADYFAATSPELFRNLWSLAIEEQFYLVWPFAVIGVVALLRAGRARTAVALVAAAGLCSAAAMALAWAPGTDPTTVYYGTATHGFGLLCGAALAVRRAAVPVPAVARRPLLRRVAAGTAGAAALAAIVAAGFLLREDDPATYRGGLFGVAVATTVLIAAITAEPRLGALLDARPLRAVGVRSYGLYLWHWPILVLLAAALGPGATERRLPIGVVAVVLTAICAAASYRWLEEPVRRLGVRGALRGAGAGLVRGSAGERLALTASIVVAGVLGAGSVAAVASAPTASEAQAAVERGLAALSTPEPEASAARTPAADASPAPEATGPTAAAPPPTAAAEPQPPPPPPGDVVTAIGDSVMLAAAPELQAELPGIVVDATVSRQPREGPGIVEALAASGRLRPYVVIDLGTNGDFPDWVLQDMVDLAGPDRHVVFVTVAGPMEWTANVNARIARVAAANPGVQVADWEAAIDGHADLLASDGIHPGPSAGGIYADAVAAALGRAAGG
ncbi:hypothetical protein GCM10009819_35620 [Agromyces tropicus]|uniref:Acyltransferase 3 domain-containing protein n=1 Tax=Agromyces tropicus TaxID=555371 RepID=A0ABN2UWQ2_9MICO